MSDELDPPAQEDGPRFVISIDYGTTFTGAAWTLAPGGGVLPTLREVNVTQNWPGGISPKVPSKLTYTANKGQRWGHGIGDNAYVLRWTKLELEEPTRVDALDMLLQLLSEAELLGGFDRGPGAGPPREIPRHLTKTCGDILTDYLVQVAARVRLDIGSEIERGTLHEHPVDLVITHPAIWSQRARNITFRAATEAFEKQFPSMLTNPGHIRMATEPEACAQYTVRDSVKDGKTHISDILRKGECFVVVDAGGGTVDLVSYLVEEITPFRIRKISDVSGDQCGATCVDDYFLHTFLRQRLGEENYEKLLGLGDQHGSGAHNVLRKGEQLMLDRFESIKHKFAGAPEPGQTVDPDVILLPDDLEVHNDPVQGIQDGQLFISWKELAAMFQKSVDGTLRLIHQQLVQVDEMHLRPGVTTILLSGGFSQSPYFRRCVKELADSYQIRVLQGKDCWTAVAKGAVLMGLGMGCDIPPALSKCPYHIGVVVSSRFTDFDHNERQRYTDSFDQGVRAKNTIHWVIAKGDLITPDEGIQRTLKMVKKMTLNGRRAGTVTVITSAGPAQGDVPTQYDPNASGTQMPIMLNYDLSLIPQPSQSTSWYRTLTSQSGMQYHKVELQLDITVRQKELELELVCGRIVDGLGNRVTAGHLLANRRITLP